jgi:hypothetical protein
MHLRLFVGLVVALGLCAAPTPSRADQRRDYMLTGLPAGDRLLLDYLGTGARLSIEHRRNIYGRSNDYTLGVNTLFTYPLTQVEATASVRALWFELGVAAGYRVLWKNLRFEPGENGEYCRECDRAARRHSDPLFGSGSSTDDFPFAEARLQLYAPFNEHFVFTSLFAMRYEGLAARSYDWFFTTVHDPGWMPRWEAIAMFKHRDFGAIGPYLMVSSIPRAGGHDNEFAFGFNAMTRLGLIDRNDMLFITALMRPGDGLYGVHSYFAPVRALIVYRVTLSL